MVIPVDECSKCGRKMIKYQDKNNVWIIECEWCKEQERNEKKC